jgi:predicted nucleotidyltransferase
MTSIPSVPLQRELEDLLSSPIRLQVAKLLVERPERDFTGREVARSIGASHSTVNQALAQLADAGLVYARILGRATAHRANTDSYLHHAIHELLRLESGLAAAMEDAIRARLEDVALSLVVFGSYARGDASRGSDLDLLVVTDDPPKVEERLAALEGHFIRAFGVRLSPRVVTRADLSKRPLPPYLRAARQEGLSIAGPRLDQLR